MKKWWGVMACSEKANETLKMYEEMFESKAIEEWKGFYRIDFENGKFYVMSAPNNSPYLILEVPDIVAETRRLEVLGYEVMPTFEIPLGKFTFYEDKNSNTFGIIELSETK